MIQLAIFLTDFADAGVVIPLCTAVTLTLLLLGRLRLALLWTAVSLAVWGTMLLLKIAGYAMLSVTPAVRDEIGLVTASGHAAGAAAAYGALAGLLAGPAETAIRRSALTALAIALLIGVTRVALREHTLAEAVLGGAVGVAGATAFAALAREVLLGRRRAVLLATSLTALLILHGEHLTLEHAIATASTRAVQTLHPD